MVKSNIDDIYPEYFPKTHAKGLLDTLDVRVPDHVTVLLLGGANRTNEVKIDETSHIATPLDIPHIDTIKNDDDIQRVLKDFFNLNLNTTAGLRRVNNLFKASIHSMYYTYHRNIPLSVYNELTNIGGIADIRKIISRIKNRREFFSFYCAIIKCAWVYHNISSNKQISDILSNSKKYLERFKTTVIGKHFEISYDEPTSDEETEGNYVGGTIRGSFIAANKKRINFTLKYRAKSLESQHRKGVNDPSVREKQIVNDLIGFEFEMKTKEEILLLLDYIFRNIVMSNYSKTRTLKTIVDYFGFTLRQKNLFTKKDIDIFISKHGKYIDPVYIEILKEGIKNDIHADNSPEYQDIKFQGIYQFPGTDEVPAEIRVVLEGNTNNKGFAHYKIREGFSVVEANLRMFYLIDVALIEREAKIVSRKKGVEKNWQDIFTHYCQKLSSVYESNGKYFYSHEMIETLKVNGFSFHPKQNTRRTIKFEKE